MTLRKKTIVIIGLTLATLLAVFYLISSTVLLNGFEEVETEETRQDVKRSIDALVDDVTALENSTRNWAVEDDTYAFVNDGDDEYVKTIETSFINNNLNLMLFIDSAGNPVFSEAFDLSAKKKVSLPES